MSSFLAAGLAWLETDETSAGDGHGGDERDDGETAEQSAHGASFRVATRHRVAAAGRAPGPGVSIGADPPGKVKPVVPGRAPDAAP